MTMKAIGSGNIRRRNNPLWECWKVRFIFIDKSCGAAHHDKEDVTPAESDLQRLYDEHAQALFAFLLNFTRDENDTRDLLPGNFHTDRPAAGTPARRA